MSKYVVKLSVRNANTVVTGSNPHQSFEISKDGKRMVPTTTGIKSNNWLDYPCDTFHFNHVNNMLHVMMGERPVPTFRNINKLWSHVPEISAIAANCRVKITHGIHHKCVGTNGYTLRPMQTRKTMKTSHNANKRKIILNGEEKDLIMPVDMTWDRLRNFMGGFHFDNMKRMCDTHLGIGIFGVLPIHRVIEKLNVIKADISDNPFWDSVFIDAIGKPHPLKKMFRDIIIDGIVDGKFFGRTGYARNDHMYEDTITRGFEKSRSVSGFIFVTIDDTQLALFNKGTGFATILDGGLVKIDSIVPLEFDTLIGTIPVFGGPV